MLIKFPYLVDKYKLNVHGILHIGAHECEEDKDYKIKGVHNIIWIEAIKEKADKSRRGKRIVWNAVVSDVDNQEVEFKITNNFQSSSILPMKTHLKEHPHVKVVLIRKLLTKRIDTLYKENGTDPKFANFINIDLQGTELPALKGMGDLLDNFDYIYAEVNEKELYEGCALLPEFEAFLDEKGFKRVEMKMLKHGWGDAFYMRK